MRVTPILALILLLITSSARAELKPGDPAPTLKVGSFVKGGPVDAFEPGKVYILNFWSTWSQPSADMVTYLTDLHEKYSSRGVTVIGISVAEKDPAQPDVKEYVEFMAGDMNYIVATDDRSDGGRGVMSGAYMRASGQTGVPMSFIIDQKGRIAWIGNGDHEPALKAILAGKFDIEKDLERQRRLKEIEDALDPLLKDTNWMEYIPRITEYIKQNPDLASELMLWKFSVQLHAMRDTKTAYVTADEVTKMNDPTLMNAVAWMIATELGYERPDLDLALRVAQKAVELDKYTDPQIIDTLARIHFDRGETGKAIEFETMAVEKSVGRLRAELQKVLDRYKAAAK